MWISLHIDFMLRNDIYRIIDANINRASEALRVLEDYVRFIKDNKPTSEKLKNIRHYLNVLFLPFTNLILNRDSQNDIGRDIENPSGKKTIKDIICANCKRLEEALRVLSEYGQLLHLDVKKLEDARYEIYTIEKDLIINEKLFRLHNAKLYLVAGRNVASQRLYDDTTFLSIIEKSIEGGVDIIQLREKNEKESKILDLAKEIKKIINGTDVLFILNDRVDLALACDADGVHLGQDDLPVSEARKITPYGFIIGLSTHSIEQGQDVVMARHGTPLPDYLGVGPVFSTPTKPNYNPCGLEYVKWASENLTEIEIPYFAIGGIDETNIDKVINAGTTKVAVVRAIMNAKDPLGAAKQLKNLIFGNKKDYVQIR